MIKVSFLVLVALALVACQSYAPVPDISGSVSRTEAGSAASLPSITGPPKTSALKREQPNAAVVALLDRADAQLERDDLDAASASLERAIRISPREADLYFSLARVRLLQDNSAQALQLCRKAESYAADRRFMELKCAALLEP